ncbi:hypothetical protein [Streptomyces klenkii]|uniref:hypothetical protein n=1 Tax=Streptomyces klenkii TaxID=1420899 RepID=UPI003440C926
MALGDSVGLALLTDLDSLRTDDGTPLSLLTFTVSDGRITEITAVVDPVGLALIGLPDPMRLPAGRTFLVHPCAACRAGVLALLPRRPSPKKPGFFQRRDKDAGKSAFCPPDDVYRQVGDR